MVKVGTARRISEIFWDVVEEGLTSAVWFGFVIGAAIACAGIDIVTAAFSKVEARNSRRSLLWRMVQSASSVEGDRCSNWSSRCRRCCINEKMGSSLLVLHLVLKLLLGIWIVV